MNRHLWVTVAAAVLGLVLAVGWLIWSDRELNVTFVVPTFTTPRVAP